MFAQERTSYYIKVQEGISLGTIQKTVNPDETLTLTTANTAFTTFLNTKSMYEFKEAFPGANTSSLQRVYKLIMPANEPYLDIEERVEVDVVYALDNQPALLEHTGTIGVPTPINDPYPNDYIELIYENLPNTALEVMKARLAWKVTEADPSIIVGMSDGPIDFTHEDLQGISAGYIHISGNINTSKGHGTSVSSLITANTNNGIGMASIAHNAKIYSVGTNGGLIDLNEGVWTLSQIPGVRVINCSFASTYNNSIYEEMYANIADRGILVVAGAGNVADSVYRFPASYSSTLSVTTVGSRYPIGYQHPHPSTGEGGLWSKAWIDVFQIRPIDYPDQFLTHNDKVDVTAPTNTIVGATNQYHLWPSGYRALGTSSAATPLVTGLAALVFSANPALTGNEVKEIIRNTADNIYHIPYNGFFTGTLGTGRINAFRAVKTAKCMAEPSIELDLAMQNSTLDLFDEPDVETQHVWNSTDIWVRNQDDGSYMTTHQNPEYSTNQPNYAYVRVTNNSCKISTGTENLKLYWAKANTALSWPLHWEGNLSITDPITNQDILMGDEIGTASIPSLTPGESKIVKFEWLIPNPEDYTNINNNPWHFCLLARIDTPSDPMTHVEGNAITTNVTSNNNIAWKNMTVIDVLPNLSGKISGVIGVGNYTAQQRAYYLEFVAEQNEVGGKLHEEAEIVVTLDAIVKDAWDMGGTESVNFKNTKDPYKKVIVNDSARLNNIIFEPGAIGTLNLSFHFLTKKLTNKYRFTYHVIQRDALTHEIIGGETYLINRQPKPIFTANAGNDKEIDKNESVTITAAQINEAATYNWYDLEGNLIHTGQDLTIAPDLTKKYKLEIVRDSDGFKDYDEVEVKVNPYKLESLVPNPATNQVSIYYDAALAGSAYLIVVDTQSGTTNNYILDPQQTIKVLDISTYQTGSYTIGLVCDGEMQNAKILVKQ